jgi:glyoxylase-like metal-dependent hydrolase (beta-lactamase superfamily II)
VHKGDWEDAHEPTPKSKASYLKENFDPLEATGRLVLLEGDVSEILPGLSFRVTGGHISYHQVLVLDIEEGGLIFWGDLVPTHHHLRIPYVAAYDLYPVELMQVKERLLDESYQKQWLNVFEHDLQCSFGVLAKDEAKGAYQLRS